LVPAFDGGDFSFWIFGSGKGLRLPIMLRQVSIDSGPFAHQQVGGAGHSATVVAAKLTHQSGATKPWAQSQTA
jgi:hypothetical protein